MGPLGFGGFSMEPPCSTIDTQTYERQLDRIQSFHPRIDSKVSALFAITTGQVAIAIVNLRPDDLQLWIGIPLEFFGAIAIYIYVQLYRCAFPHLEGGEGSLVYFREIAKLSSEQYADKFGKISQDELKADLICQIWRNSEIVAMKYDRLKCATVAVTLALIPWTVFLVATSLRHWEVPKIAG